MKAVCPRDESHSVKFNGGNVWCLDCDQPAATRASITDLNAARKRREGLRANARCSTCGQFKRFCRCEP